MFLHHAQAEHPHQVHHAVHNKQHLDKRRSCRRLQDCELSKYGLTIDPTTGKLKLTPGCLSRWSIQQFLFVYYRLIWEIYEEKETRFYRILIAVQVFLFFSSSTCIGDLRYVWTDKVFMDFHCHFCSPNSSLIGFIVWFFAPLSSQMFDTGLADLC